MKAILGACRGCMLPVASHERRNGPELAKMFTYCTDIKMMKGENLPQHFCPSCSECIDSCFRFISKARKVNSTMRNYVSVVSQNSADDISTDYSAVCTKKEAPDDCDSLYDQPIKVENLGFDQKSICEVEIFPSQDFYDETLENDQFLDQDEKEISVKIEQKKQTTVTETLKQSKHQKCSGSAGTKCPFCKKTFSSKIWYERHVNTAHKDATIRVKKFVCTICSKGFSRSDILTQHMVTHSDERPFPCHLCPNKYKMRKQLNCHLRMHRDQVEYRCDMCSASFKWKAVLLNHIKSHDGQKQHLCDLCGAGFSQLGNLVQHMRTHSGEKPFACPHCPFRCSMSSSMRRHQRIHDGTKPHTCHTCGKRFRDYSSLLRHIRTHTGELPYRCMFCSQAFIDSGKRKRHILRHHPVAVTPSPIAPPRSPPAARKRLRTVDRIAFERMSS